MSPPCSCHRMASEAQGQIPKLTILVVGSPELRPTGPASLCCPGKVQGLFSLVLQLGRGKIFRLLCKTCCLVAEPQNCDALAFSLIPTVTSLKQLINTWEILKVLRQVLCVNSYLCCGYISYSQCGYKTFSTGTLATAPEVHNLGSLRKTRETPHLTDSNTKCGKLLHTAKALAYIQYNFKTSINYRNTSIHELI